MLLHPNEQRGMQKTWKTKKTVREVIKIKLRSRKSEKLARADLVRARGLDVSWLLAFVANSLR